MASKKQKGNFYKRWLGGGVMEDDRFRKVLFYIVFLAVLAVIYIGNSFFAIRSLRNIDSMERSIKLKKVEFITARAQLVDSTKQSRIAKKVAPLGLKEAIEPPQLIFINSEDFDVE